MFIPKQNLLLQTTLIAFFLGTCFTFGGALMMHSVWYTGSVAEYAVGAYIVCAVVLFHMSEFLAAALFNRHDTHPSAFMLFHSPTYIAAFLSVWVEFLAELFLVPEDWKISEDSPWFWLLRLNYTTSSCAALLTVALYMVRVIGMLQCGANFSLVIELERRSNHVLVTHGVYRVLRHPAYFGFFWKSLASQLIVANPVCFFVHGVILVRFFRERIAYEEELLVSEKFFGEQYKEYRTKTWVGIPFVR